MVDQVYIKDYPTDYSALPGKVMVVTGGGSGIGQQIAQDLYQHNALVYILGRTEDKLRAAQEEICQKVPMSEGTISVRVCDVSIEDQVNAVFEDIRRVSGPVYGLVNNAGINPSRNDVLHTTAEDWKRTLDVNITGALYCAKAAMAQMVEQRDGCIVNVASIAGVYPLEKRTAYNVSKFAMIGLTLTLAKDYEEQGIRSHAVCPGYVRTPLTASFFDAMPKDKFLEILAYQGRLLEPEEISRAVVALLAVPEVKTGQVVLVDNGFVEFHETLDFWKEYLESSSCA